MDIRHKLYPHPVLKNETDDYKTSHFSCELKQDRGVKKFLMEAHFSLDNPQLLQLIEEEKAEYVLHIECSLSAFRCVIASKTPSFKFDLEDSRLLDKVSICSFLLAKTDITHYTNEDFDDDYMDTTFPCEKGTILAVGSQSVFSVEKDKNDLASVPSIFKIYLKLDHEGQGAMIELDDNDIKIGLSQEDYKNYQLQCRSHTKVVNAFLILPTLIYALDYLKTDFIELEDLKWVQALKVAFKRGGQTLNQALLDSTPSVTLAQTILQNPISSAFSEIDEQFNRWEEEE